MARNAATILTAPLRSGHEPGTDRNSLIELEGTMTTSDSSADTLHFRLDRLESIEAIRDLSHRYAAAADLRDFAALATLFVVDVDCGRWGSGREALLKYYDAGWRTFYRSMHAVTSLTIEFADSDNASGTVFMRAEHEVADHWIVVGMALFDNYERKDGRWYFRRRRFEALYSHDQLERPQDVAFARSFADDPRAPTLPHSQPSWQMFWEANSHDAIRLSRYP